MTDKNAGGAVSEILNSPQIPALYVPVASIESVNALTLCDWLVSYSTATRVMVLG